MVVVDSQTANATTNKCLLMFADQASNLIIAIMNLLLSAPGK
jgi:hypothetical protein